MCVIITKDVCSTIVKLCSALFSDALQSCYTITIHLYQMAVNLAGEICVAYKI